MTYPVFYSLHAQEFLVVRRLSYTNCFELSKSECRLVEDFLVPDLLMKGSRDQLDLIEPSENWQKLAIRFQNFETIIFEDFYPSEKKQENSKAQHVAEKVHQGQKYGELPYVKHLEEVVKVIAEFKKVINDFFHVDHIEDLKEIAWLHDSLEDTPITYAELLKDFGPVISDAVESLSIRAEEKGKSLQSFELYLQRIKKHRLAVIVKLADRIANMRATLRHPTAALIDKYSAQAPAVDAAFCDCAPLPMLNQIMQLDFFLQQLKSQRSEIQK